MNNIDKYDQLNLSFYLESEIDLSNINCLLETNKELWSLIEKMILSERNFLFESDEE